MTASTQVAVLGGGPAGAAAAVGLASQGVDVTILHADKKSQSKVFETLSPPSRPLLEHVGVWNELLNDGHHPVYGNRSRWGSERIEETSYVFHPHGHGWRLDRPLFDSRLRRQAVDRGAKLSGCVQGLGVDRTDGAWRLSWNQKSGARELTAQYLIDATGRQSWLARRLGAKRLHHDRLVGFAGRVPIDATTRQAATLVEAVRCGWWYSIDLPASSQREAVLFTDHDLPEAKLAATRTGWLDLFRQAEETARRVSAMELESPPVVLNSRSGVLDKAAGEGWLAAGDAAWTGDPLSSTGLATALKSGLEAAAVVSDQLASRSSQTKTGYARRVAMNYEAELMLQTAYYRMEQRWPGSPFWARRQSIHA